VLFDVAAVDVLSRSFVVHQVEVCARLQSDKGCGIGMTNATSQFAVTYGELIVIVIHEQMELSLREAEADYQIGRHASHSSICERYGV